MEAKQEPKSTYDKIVFRLKNNKIIAILIFIATLLIAFPTLYNSTKVVGKIIFPAPVLNRVDFQDVSEIRKGISMLQSKIGEQLSLDKPNKGLLKIYFNRYVDVTQERCQLTSQDIKLVEKSAEESGVDAKYLHQLTLIREHTSAGCSKKAALAYGIF
jgi:hypothetical protein